jgi:hypothetical protein
MLRSFLAFALLAWSASCLAAKAYGNDCYSEDLWEDAEDMFARSLVESISVKLAQPRDSTVAQALYERSKQWNTVVSVEQTDYTNTPTDANQPGRIGAGNASQFKDVRYVCDFIIEQRALWSPSNAIQEVAPSRKGPMLRTRYQLLLKRDRTFTRGMNHKESTVCVFEDYARYATPQSSANEVRAMVERNSETGYCEE